MSADLTPRFVPPVDRRRPDPRPEAVRLDPEAARAAIEEAEVAQKAGVGLANIVVLAFLAGLRSLKASARRGARYVVESTGDVLEGVSPADVAEFLRVQHRYGGAEGPRGEDATARALAAVFQLREDRAARERTFYRRRDPGVDEMVATVAHRVAIHRTVVSGARR